MSDNEIYAKDYNCVRCPKVAEFFVGLADPDAKKFPMCKECADKWRIEVLMELLNDKTD